MRKKYLRKCIFLLIIMLVSLNFLGCSKKVVKVNADYHYYSTIESLLKESDVIIMGQTVNVNKGEKLNINMDKKGIPDELVYTVSEIKITEVIKGDVKPEEVIKVKQRGGTYDNKVYKVDGMEYLVKGKDYILFLGSFVDIDPNEPYVLMNPNQGYLEIVDGKIKVNKNNTLFKSGVTKEEIKKSLIKENP